MDLINNYTSIDYSDWSEVQIKGASTENPIDLGLSSSASGDTSSMKTQNSDIKPKAQLKDHQLITENIYKASKIGEQNQAHVLTFDKYKLFQEVLAEQK